MTGRKPGKKQTHKIECRFFKWQIYLRQPSGMWYADGRSNDIDLGRHSVGTRSLQDAKDLIHDLDLVQAVKFKKAHPRLLSQCSDNSLPIERGLELHEAHTERPDVAGGIKDSTKKRYRRIKNAFRAFLRSERILYWEQVDASVLNNYAEHRRERYTIDSVATELVHIKSVHRYLLQEKYIDKDFEFTFRVHRTKDSTRYSPSRVEMKEILSKLETNSEQRWLYQAAVVLAYTGMRFNELAQITRDDVDFQTRLIHVVDETGVGGKKTTKTGCSRTIPMHEVVHTVMFSVPHVTDGPMLRGPRGGKLRSDTFNDYLRKHALRPLATKISNPRFQSVTAHSFRHFFVSFCGAMGVSQQTCMDWAGHRTTAMSQRYFHTDDQASLANIARLDRLTDVPSDFSDGTQLNPDGPEHNGPAAEEQCDSDT